MKIIFFILILSVSVEAYAQQRIRFQTGQTKTTVAGSLKGISDEACYVLKAAKGQNMKIDASKSKGSVRVMVTSPSGEENGSPGGVEWENLPESGDYKICVEESPMGEKWRGKFYLEISVN